VYGHIHCFANGEFGGRRVASIGSVGMPFDHDPRAAYAIASHEGGGWTIEPKRVPYDNGAVADEVLARGAQAAEGRARRFREAACLPMRT